jgi:hypothetical protein
METALFQQFLNIAQRERIAKIPPDRTEYEAGFGLTPFEDRGSGSHFRDSFTSPASNSESCNTSSIVMDRTTLASHSSLAIPCFSAVVHPEPDRT